MVNEKNRHFLKNWHPVHRLKSFAAWRAGGGGGGVPNQDRQTPHTVIQKLSPKTFRTLLTEYLIKSWMDIEEILCLDI